MAKDFIQKAIKKPGALRKSLGIKKGEKIPASKLKAAAKKKGKMGQRARLAITLSKLKEKKMKPVPAGKKGKGLRKLPKAVRNKMGFMKKGGRVKKRKSNGEKKRKHSRQT